MALKEGESKVYGPYKGSKANGGRPVMVLRRKVKGKVVTSSTNAARYLYEKAKGKKLPEDQDVNHKDNKGRAGTNDKIDNLDVKSHKDNVAMENTRRKTGKVTPVKKAKKKADKK